MSVAVARNPAKRELFDRERRLSISLLPLGRGLTVRADVFRRMTGGGTTQSFGSVEHPALVFEGGGLDEPLWVVFKEVWHDRPHYFDAALAFINSR